MTTEPEYCAECTIILRSGSVSWGGITCRPCGQKVCDRYCLSEHKRHCAGALEAKARRQAKGKP